MNKTAYWILGIAAFVIVGSGALLYYQNRTAGPGDTRLDTFAKCLAQKNITMFGSEGCAHCANEKRRFGSSWKYVPYVECSDDPKLCLEKGIEGYPTWLLPDGTKLLGEQGLEKLSQASGCPLITEISSPSP